MHYDFLLSNKEFKKSKKLVLFCNQSSFDFRRKQYLFDILIDQVKLKRILMPEHGLFSEIQDQGNIGNRAYRNVECISLYDKEEGITKPTKEFLSDSDGFIIDIQDVGVRYFTYTFHLFAILDLISKLNTDLPIFIIDRKNPIGTKCEGSVIQSEYQSFLGPAGLIHRHGLSTGQLCEWYIKRNSLSICLYKIEFPDSKQHLFIPPSPNLPSQNSLNVYPGQCFWEATTFSEGRGTTLPFELVGSPNLSIEIATKISLSFNKLFSDKAFIRPTFFIPVFHKHMNRTCVGWHLFIENDQTYHTILGSLFLMQQSNLYLDNQKFWREGAYEFDSSHTAACLLLGDDDLIGFVDGQISSKLIEDKLISEEENWKLIVAELKS